MAPSSGSSASLLSVAAAIVGCHQTPKCPADRWCATTDDGQWTTLGRVSFHCTAMRRNTCERKTDGQFQWLQLKDAASLLTWHSVARAHPAEYCRLFTIVTTLFASQQQSELPESRLCAAVQCRVSTAFHQVRCVDHDPACPVRDNSCNLIHNTGALIGTENMSLYATQAAPFPCCAG